MKKENIFKKMMKFEGTKESEVDILTRLYGETYVKEMQEKEVNKKIAKRDKKDKKKGRIVPQVDLSSEREYSYVRMMPEAGRMNQVGITEEQYNDPNYIGYKVKLMKSAYLKEGNPRFIQIEHRGKYTKAEQEELAIIEKNKQALNTTMEREE